MLGQRLTAFDPIGTQSTVDPILDIEVRKPGDGAQHPASIRSLKPTAHPGIAGRSVG